MLKKKVPLCSKIKNCKNVPKTNSMVYLSHITTNRVAQKYSIPQIAYYPLPHNMIKQL